MARLLFYPAAVREGDAADGDDTDDAGHTNCLVGGASELYIEDSRFFSSALKDCKEMLDGNNLWSANMPASWILYAKNLCNRPRNRVGKVQDNEVRIGVK